MRPVYFLIFIAAVTIFFMIELFNPFLKAIFVALLLAVATNSVTLYLENRLKSKLSATFVMSVTLACIFFIPVLYCIFAIANYFNHALIKEFNVLKLWVQSLSDDFLFVKEQLSFILAKVDVGLIAQKTLAIGGAVGKNSAGFMMDMVLILIFYFF